MIYSVDQVFFVDTLIAERYTVNWCYGIVGDSVGFNISTNDDDGVDSEEAALFWTEEPPDIYSNEHVWGDLIFGEFAAVSPAGKLAAIWRKMKT